MTIVYSYYVLDILHSGHIQMLRNAQQIAGPGGVSIVGILTDEAVMERKPRPILAFDERAEIARSIRFVDVVVPQESYSPLPNVLRIRPTILLESASHTKVDIDAALDTMTTLGGSVIVCPYWPRQSSTRIKLSIRGSQAPHRDSTDA